jgi:hypothetical protein
MFGNRNVVFNPVPDRMDKVLAKDPIKKGSSLFGNGNGNGYE